MTKRLFLTSYFAQTASLFEKYGQPWIKDKEVLFIPTAGNHEAYRAYIEEAEQAFRRMGYQIAMLDIAEAEEAEAVRQIGRTGFLYISGGNTFYLLQELQKKHLTEVICRRVSEGMVYAGESAGAIIAAPDIAYNHIMDDRAAAPDLKSSRGLGLVPFSVLPHYGEFPFEKTAAETLKAYRASLDLVPLTNSEAVISEGNSWHVVRQEGKESGR